MHKVCHILNDDQHQGARKEKPDAKAALLQSFQAGRKSDSGEQAPYQQCADVGIQITLEGLGLVCSATSMIEKIKPPMTGSVIKRLPLNNKKP